MGSNQTLSRISRRRIASDCSVAKEEGRGLRQVEGGGSTCGANYMGLTKKKKERGCSRSGRNRSRYEWVLTCGGCSLRVGVDFWRALPGGKGMSRGAFRHPICPGVHANFRVHGLGFKVGG